MKIAAILFSTALSMTAGLAVAQDAMKKDGAMSKDMTMEQCKDHMAMQKTEMKKDDMSMKKDTMCADMMKKHDSMMKPDGMKKDDGMMKKDGMAPNPMKK